ncbi:MAG: ribbon-helix-helix domain-containing protein [Candidatus Jordarchaeales archaeon]
MSFRVPEEYLRGLEVLIARGVFKSRSEAVRVAVRELLEREGLLSGEVLVLDE